MKKQTSEVAISKDVYRAVAKRDSFDGWPCCIWCGKPAPTENPLAYANAHYIPRSLGGLGIEENILNLCFRCHYKYDRTTSREEMRAFFENHLRHHYKNWNEENLIYRKDM